MTVSMSVMVANGSVPGGVKKPPQMGVKFWAKLDFQNFFGSLPREAIKAALDHYGYADEFIEIVMAMVEAPVVLRRWAKNHDITKKKGTEQGVAESPVLANLVPFELDEWFQKRAKRILYRRYADDIFIGAATRDEVVGAVRQVQRCPPFSSHPGHFDDREVGKFRLRPGDLLACEGRHIGRCALWNGELDECYYQKALHRLRSKDGRVTSAYMQHFMMLRFRFMTDLVAEANTTSTIPHLPREKLLILPVWYPPREEQDEIVEALGAEAGREQSEVLYLAELQGVKAALMSVLLTGEVRVKPGEDAA